MDRRTFFTPNVRFESEIEFCTPSWKRKRKYLSWNHWFTTKTSNGSLGKVDRTVRYKLFEMGHYAGSVILEIGLQDAGSVVMVKAAKEAGHEVQYFGVETDAEMIRQSSERFRKKRIDKNALFFRGTLAEFRSAIPVTPTMVVLNRCGDTRSLLAHLALFLSTGTPVLVRNWFQTRDEFKGQQIEGFETIGRFGESILLQSCTDFSDAPSTLQDSEFQSIREKHSSRIDLNDLANRVGNIEEDSSDKKWPFRSNKVQYPSTLPDGSPWPKISVVTPTYNQGKFIEQTINSVLHQDYPNLEYIVVDGQSTDETREILDRYKDRLTHCISEPDDGQSDAINKGMGLATGEILTWLNSDDMLTPGTLYSMAMAFWKSNADMVVGAVQFLKDGEIVGEHLTSCSNGPLELSELLDLDNNWLKGRFFFQPELMFTRDLWQRSGGYVDTNLYYSMDHELWLRFAIAGARMHVIGRPTVIYRVHDEQKTHEDYRPELRSVNRRYIEKFGAAKPPHKLLAPKKYRVTFVNDVGVRYGAGIAHGRLRDAMDAAGHETTFIAAKSEEQPIAKSESDLMCEISESNPDLVVVGNLHNASLDVNLVDRISDRWPVIFVMHDLWMSTGRCCYLGGCEKFLSSCDSDCPTAEQYPPLNPEQIERSFESKLNVVSKPRKVVVMTNSEWTTSVAAQSSITSKSVLKTLKYGFPTHIYQPRDKDLCREILGLPTDSFIVLFASVDVSEERKGLRHLFEALNRLQLKNLVPVCIGHANKKADLYPGTISLGYVNDPWKSALIFSAADIFVGPSLQEAFGQVFIESAACGTPSIAYPVGGVVHAIEDGVTGRLAKRVHPSALAEEIELLYRDEDYRKDLGIWGRIEVENEWSLRSCYHHFNHLLRQAPEHIGFLPPSNIAFDPSKTHGIPKFKGHCFGILEKEGNTLAFGTGFAEEEILETLSGQKKRVRWAFGSRCEIDLRISDDSPQEILATCFSPVDIQKMKVLLNGNLINELEVFGKNDFLEPIQLRLAHHVAPGEYKVEIQFSNSVNEQNGERDLAMLFSELRIASANLNPNQDSVAA